MYLLDVIIVQRKLSLTIWIILYCLGWIRVLKICGCSFNVSNYGLLGSVDIFTFWRYRVIYSLQIFGALCSWLLGFMYFMCVRLCISFFFPFTFWGLCNHMLDFDAELRKGKLHIECLFILISNSSKDNYRFCMQKWAGL